MKIQILKVRLAGFILGKIDDINHNLINAEFAVVFTLNKFYSMLEIVQS